MEDFDLDLANQLVALSEKHDFLIFEDRKFADIGELLVHPFHGPGKSAPTITSNCAPSPGNTVALQYSRGVHRIASWSHITNAHPVPGPSVVTGLASIGLPLNRGLLLLAEMSSQGTLAKGEYTQSALAMAREHRNFVIGFIAMQRMTTTDDAAAANEDFLILTPGVGLDVKGDGMGQQYKTPRQVILERGCDVIIVGRGIYGKGEGSPSEVIAAEAKRYQQEGWAAYEERLQLAK